MTREDIIRMAREIKGASRASAVDGSLWLLSESHLERFAALVAEREREQCAKVCEARYMGDNNREDEEAKRCAAAIRARGQE
jgi:hypothetical protein